MEIKEKQLSIFKSLFIGRTDVYAEAWKNKKGKTGYTPVCKNKSTSLCKSNDSVLKCSHCPNQEFKPLSDQVFLKHLSGQSLIAIYPILKNNLCFLITADFDNHQSPDYQPAGHQPNALQDAKNFTDACINRYGLPCYLERSKSGRGYHTWIFFSQPIPTWKVRLVANFILNENGAKPTSFDRFFPNQDELNTNGYLGNCITLPLYGRVFKEGNSTFLDQNLTPITTDDIWSFLQGIEKVGEPQLDKIISTQNLVRKQSKRFTQPQPFSISPHMQIKSVIEECEFIKYCQNNSSEISEPLWYDMISNLARFDGARSIIHEFSSGHPGYSPQETDKKIDHAIEASNPISCDKIKSDGFNCGKNCGVKSPAGLGAKYKDTKSSKDSQKTGKKKKLPDLTNEFIISCHNDLLNNPALYSKWGLSYTIIFKYHLGIFEDNLIFPLTDEAGIFIDAYLFQNNRLEAFINKKRVCFLPFEMLNNHTIIFCDDFLDFIAALSFGLNAITIPFSISESKTRQELNNNLRGKNIILIATNTKESELKIINLGKQLSGIAKSIKAITVWPKIISPGEGLRHFLEKEGISKLQTIIELSLEFTCNLKTLDGVYFFDPKDFTITEDMVMYTEYKDSIPYQKNICHTGIIIAGRAIELDAGTEELEICFKRDDQWKRITEPRQTFTDKNKILSLSNRGFPVNSKNCTKIIEFLAEFEATNITRIPKNILVYGCGWKTIQKKEVFALGETIIGLKKETDKKNTNDQKQKSTRIIHKPPPGFERFGKALQPVGTYQDWVKIIESVLKYPTVAFAFYATFAPIIIPKIKTYNFIIDLWGSTSVGKTTCLEICSSVFGNPQKEAGGLIVSWNSSKVYAEYISNYFNHCPIFLDDSQTANDRDVERILYMIANGMGKGRGRPDGIRPMMTWNTVCLSTGEKPLTECTTFGGAMARTIEIYGPVFPGANGGFISDIKSEVKKNYGHAGQRFIQKFLYLLETEKDKNFLEKEWSQYQKAMSKQANSEIGDRLAGYFATTHLAANLVTRLLKIGKPSEVEETISKLFTKIVVNSENQSDLAARAMEYILSWARGNKNFFESDDTISSKTEIYGIWKPGKFIAIRPHKLEEELLRKNFSCAGILKMWAERKWLDRNPKKYTKWVTIGKNERERMICIPWEITTSF